MHSHMCERKGRKPGSGRGLEIFTAAAAAPPPLSKSYLHPCTGSIAPLGFHVSGSLPVFGSPLKPYIQIILSVCCVIMETNCEVDFVM